ncbi:cell envelope biogenesis protein OmpA [Sorangium cellulosum]|nr:cell envelope biogenesis protein OmpA [Sorangium cellulosum]
MDRRNLPGGKPRRPSRLRCALTAAALAAPALVALAPSTARAQDRTFYLDRLRMAGAPDDGIGVWRPHMGEKTRLFGQLGLGASVHPLRNDNYVDDLAVEEQLEGEGPVTSQLITYLSAGVEILGRGALQASFPIVVFQDGNQTCHPDRTLGLDQCVNLKTATPMDLRLDARLVALELDERRFRLGLTAAVFVPVGNVYSFGGDRTVSSAFGLGAEYDFKDFFVTLNTGVAIRPPVRLHELRVGTELTYGVGGYVPLVDDTVRVGAEIFGSFGLREETLGELDASPIEWQLNGRMALTKDKALYAGAGVGTRMSGGYAPDFRGVAVVGYSFSIADSGTRSPGFNYVIEQEKDTDGDGYPDVIDLCPEDPEDGKQPKPADGCPDNRDGDGIPDVVDKCPDDPEDKDGIDDRDGCPEDDADQDGIPDAEDKCPKEPGQVVVDEPEKNGCPYYIRRITGSAEIEIMKQVEFEFDSSRILPQSYPILDEVVRLLKANPEIKLLSIEGHTDNQGTIDYNDRLAHNRAIAVRVYLINKGIQSERLTSVGYGSRRPLVANDTPEGRQRNRRVEFHIKSQSIEGR